MTNCFPLFVFTSQYYNEKCVYYSINIKRGKICTTLLALTGGFFGTRRRIYYDVGNLFVFYTESWLDTQYEKLTLVRLDIRILSELFVNRTLKLYRLSRNFVIKIIIPKLQLRLSNHSRTSSTLLKPVAEYKKISDEIDLSTLNVRHAKQFVFDAVSVKKRITTYSI